MTGPLLLLVALVVGIVGGDVVGPGPARALLGTAALALGAGWWLARRDAVRVALGVAVLGALLGGVALEQRALHGLAVSPLMSVIASGRSATVDVTLLEDPSGPRYRTEALVRVDALGTGTGGSRIVLLAGSGDEQSVLRVLAAGDRLRLRGTFGPLTGYSARLKWRHAVGQLTLDEARAVAPPAGGLLRIANGLRRVLLRGADVLPSTPRALLAGFILGDTRAIPTGLVDDFRNAGLSHLLAVSGANVAFALAIAEPALRRLRLGPRFAGGVAVLAVFGTMTRWEPSVLRASVMAGLVMLARLLGRPADARRVLALAALVLLVVDPFLLHSVGFLLSCGACAGIVVGSTAISHRLRGPAWFREALGVTAAAQIGVAPVLLVVFGTIPLVALPANVLAAPFVGPLTIWGIVASTVGGVLGPAIAMWLQLPTLAMLRTVELVAHVAAQVPLAVDVGTTLGLVVLTASGWAAHRAWSHRTGRVARRGRRLPREGQRSGPPGP